MAKRDFRWRFWRWLFDLSVVGMRERYMAITHHDRQCRTCGAWHSENYGCASYRDSEDGATQWTTCKRCGHETAWDMRHAIPVQIKEQTP